MDNPDARSHCAIHTSDPPSIKHNAPVHLLVKTIHGVPASASEAKIGGIFIVAQEVVPIQNTLIELGPPQLISGSPIELTTPLLMIFSQHMLV